MALARRVVALARRVTVSREPDTMLGGGPCCRVWHWLGGVPLARRVTVSREPDTMLGGALTL